MSALEGGEIFLTSDMMDIKEEEICIQFCSFQKAAAETTECYMKPLVIKPRAKAKHFTTQTLQDRSSFVADVERSRQP